MTTTTCERCGQQFLYDPAVHRCPGEWEAICAAAGLSPIEPATTTWVEECMTKQREGIILDRVSRDAWDD